MAVTLIAGLGNPGREYEETRHNIGFLVIDAFAKAVDASPWKHEEKFNGWVCRATVNGQTLHLLKPATYMNLSGTSIGLYSRFYKIPVKEILVCYDELNVDLGEVKLSVRGSAGGHNGIANILNHVGSDFIRFRLGIGPKHPPEIDIKDFVLGKFRAEEQHTVSKKMPDYLAGIRLVLTQGVDKAMNQLNQRKKENEPNRSQTAL